jgi:negative regulator of sigma E activity
MTAVTDDIAEQLSAYMDGELPEAEARFLRRRLEHDAELRATWTRMQLASHCLRGQPCRVLDAGFPERVAQGIAGVAPRAPGRPLLRWAMAASVAALALLMAPKLLTPVATPEPAATAEAAASGMDQLVPSPGSADLLALRAPDAAPRPVADSAVAPAPEDAPLLAAAAPSDRESPRPLDNPAVESPAEFPLADTGEARRWPRSELVGGTSDPAIEAYLVRHNQMLASEGLGGFVPYVDVVANGQPATASDGAPAEDEAPADAAGDDGQ